MCYNLQYYSSDYLILSTPSDVSKIAQKVSLDAQRKEHQGFIYTTLFIRGCVNCQDQWSGTPGHCGAAPALVTLCLLRKIHLRYVPKYLKIKVHSSPLAPYLWPYHECTDSIGYLVTLPPNIPERHHSSITWKPRKNDLGHFQWRHSL